MKNYIIDFSNGLTEELVAETLEEAEAYADDCIGYTQCNVEIYDADKLVALRRWWGVPPEKDLYDEDDYKRLIVFGDFGYYDTWED